MDGLKITSEVPFGHTIHTLLYLRNSSIDELELDERSEKCYLAWETVRKKMNPFFYQGTGFEGYILSRCPDSESALDAILGISQQMLDAIAREYRNQYGLRSRLMKTLTKEEEDPEAIAIWSSYLGAELGRLHAAIIKDPKVMEFRNQTYKLVSKLPRIAYQESNDDVEQTYTVGAGISPSKHKLYISLHMLNPKQQDAWLVAQNIGEFGHPLVRGLLAQAIAV